MAVKKLALFSVAGPGLLFAATSIGSSHLVQSTRAGALYGTTMIAIIIVVNLIKFPAFRFANDVYPASGLTLIDAYRKQGKWVVNVILAIALSTMLFVASALSLLSAGLLKVTAPVINMPTYWLAAIIVLISCLIVSFGRYSILEKVIKVLIIVMTVITVLAAVLAIPKIDWGTQEVFSAGSLDVAGWMFIAALIGWMPVPLDAGVWQSLWTKAKSEQLGGARPVHAFRFDFNIGFFGALFLAVCFVLIGAGLMHSREIIPESNSVAFSTQLIDLYVFAFGSYVAPIIGIAAFLTIYSSLLAVFDAGPRLLDYLYRDFRAPKNNTSADTENSVSFVFYGVLAALFIGSTIVNMFLLKSLTAFLDMAATIAFVTAPLIAFFNHRAIISDFIPQEYRPGSLMRLISIFCIIAMAAFAATYLYLRFVL